MWERFPGSRGGRDGGDGRPRGARLAGARAPTTLDGPNVHAYSDLDDNDAAAAVGGGRARGRRLLVPVRAGRRDGLRRGAPVRVERDRRPDREPRAGRRPGLLLRQPLPRPPRARSASRRPRARSRAPTTCCWRRWTARATGPDGNHLNNANMFTPPDGSHPRMQMYLWSSPFRTHLQRQRRGGPLPRVHARALEPARARRRRLRRAELRAGGRDGGGVERLVRAGLHRRASSRGWTRARRARS